MKIIHSCPFCGFDKSELVTCRELDCDNQEQSCDCDSLSYCVNCNANEGGCGAAGGYEMTVQKAIDRWNEREYLKVDETCGEFCDLFDFSGVDTTTREKILRHHVGAFWDMYQSAKREIFHLQKIINEIKILLHTERE